MTPDKFDSANGYKSFVKPSVTFQPLEGAQLPKSTLFKAAFQTAIAQPIGGNSFISYRPLVFDTEHRGVDQGLFATYSTQRQLAGKVLSVNIDVS